LIQSCVSGNLEAKIIDQYLLIGDVAVKVHNIYLFYNVQSQFAVALHNNRSQEN